MFAIVVDKKLLASKTHGDKSFDLMEQAISSIRLQGSLLFDGHAYAPALEPRLLHSYAA